MTFTKQEKALIATNIIGVLSFTVLFFCRGNYEFIVYVLVLAGLMMVILFTHKTFQYSIGLLWALTIWSFLHLIGGGLEYTEGEVFYKLMLIPLIGEPYNVLKYDQVVHFFGFWTSAVLTYYVIKPSLKNSVQNVRSVIFIIVMTSLGLSAVNEIVEFAATVIVPETNVGGYENTAIDLVANFLGALCAGIYLKCKYFSKK
ncbi:MAG: hypothetical protein CR972_05025 [Candidatus Moraniibacteriota bacterium]|nr:MAG: hypothetical protein CR972_05025 [Candidatus Moranbacteria bacterium]